MEQTGKPSTVENNFKDNTDQVPAPAVFFQICIIFNILINCLHYWVSVLIQITITIDLMLHLVWLAILIASQTQTQLYIVYILYCKHLAFDK